MMLKVAIRIGKEHDFETIEECVKNAESIISLKEDYDIVEKGINELQFCIEKLARKYDQNEYDILNWSVKEFELYEK